MSTLSKVFAVSNLVIAVALLFSGLTYFSHAHNYRALYTEAKQAISSLESRLAQEKAAYDASRQVLQSRNDFLNTALDQERTVLAQMRKTAFDQESRIRDKEEGMRATFSQMELMRQELLAAHNERQRAQQEAHKALSERDMAQRDRAQALSMAADMEAQWETLQRDQRKMQQDYEALARELDQKNLVLTKLKDQYGEIDVDAAVPRIRGTVMVVDEKSGVVVLNVGANNQVRVGYQFSVVRDDKYVGRVQVTDVNPDWAGAVLVPGMQKMAIKAGDQVSTVIE